MYFDEKPTSEEIKRYLRKTNNFEVVDKPILEIARLISDGHTILPNIFDLTERQNINKNLFQQTEWIGLDIDDGYNLDEFKNRLINMGLMPTIIYPTFSHTESHHKFRVLFHLCDVISLQNCRKFNIIMEMLHTVFPMVDRHCTDPSRMYHGTNKPIGDFYIDEGAYLDEQKLWQYFVSAIDSSTPSSSERAKKWKAISSRWAVKRLNSPAIPNVICNDGDPVIDFDFCEGYASFFTQQKARYVAPRQENESQSDRPCSTRRRSNNDVPRTDAPIENTLRIANWEQKLLRMSKLYKKFAEGEIALKYEQRFFFVTNLRYVEGGIKRFLEIIETHINIYEHSFDYYKEQTNAMKRYALYKVSIEHMIMTASYPDDDYLTHSGAHNIVDALQIRLSLPERDSYTTKISSKKAHSITKSYFDKAMHCNDNSIYTISAGVGVGKTEIYVKADYSKYKRVLICVPTHNLAKEVEHRMKEAGQQEIVRVLKRPPLEDEKDRKHYEALLASGLIKSANDFYKSCIDNLPLDETSIYHKYMYSIRDAHNPNTHIVICTHAFLTHGLNNTQFDLVIVDEDITKTFLNTRNCSLQQLEDFYANCVKPERIRAC